MIPRFRITLLAGLLALAAPAIATAADPYPTRTISIVVPFPPGGGADVLGRVIGQRLNEAWGQPVIVENKQGAAGVLGASAVGRAQPDGYTLLMAASGAIARSNIKDLAPVALVTAPPYLVAVHASLPVTTTREFIDYLKARPDEINYASSGVGSASHLATELFMSMSGTKMTHVPYRGIGPAVNDLISNKVSVMFGPPQALLPHVEAGTLKALAVTSSERSTLFSKIPTIAESGVPGYDAVGWYGLLAPAKTPADVVQKIADEVARTLKVPAVQERLISLGSTPASGTPADFGRFLEADLDKWEPLLAKLKTP